jgi:hypothetical protein
VVDPYLRILAAVSLLLVVTDAVLGVPWLPLVFPATGVLLAVGGAAAASAAEVPGAVRRALTTLLLPFWVLAGVLLAVMLASGWRADPFAGADPFDWSTVWLWLVPISAPPASVQGIPWVLTAWFVPTLLWLTLVTPALLWLFRRWPLRVLSVPVLTVVALTTGVATLTGSARGVVLDVSVYLCCWLVGFARHDGRLSALSPRAVLVLGAVLLGSGLLHAAALQDVVDAGRIDEVPLAALLCYLGVVLLLLRVPWRGDRLRTGRPGAALSAVGARTLTVFLWAPAAAAAAVPVLAASPLAAYHTDDAPGALLRFATTLLLILVAVLLVGWVEDVGAGLRPTLFGARRTAVPGVLPDAPARERSFVVEGNVVQDLAAHETSGRAG